MICSITGYMMDKGSLRLDILSSIHGKLNNIFNLVVFFYANVDKTLTDDAQ